MNNIMGAFTGFEGRLNRQRWWIGVIILAIIGIIISWILGAIFGTGLIMNPADATDPAGDWAIARSFTMRPIVAVLERAADSDRKFWAIRSMTSEVP